MIIKIILFRFSTLQIMSRVIGPIWVAQNSKVDSCLIVSFLPGLSERSHRLKSHLLYILEYPFAIIKSFWIHLLLRSRNRILVCCEIHEEITELRYLEELLLSLLRIPVHRISHNRKLHIWKRLILRIIRRCWKIQQSAIIVAMQMYDHS